MADLKHLVWGPLFGEITATEHTVWVTHVGDYCKGTVSDETD